MGVQVLLGRVNFLWQFIHVSKKPRCFKNMDMTKLPVNYFSQKKAWLTAAIFEEWFHNFFVPYVRKFCCDAGLVLNTKFYYWLTMHQHIPQRTVYGPLMER